MWMVAASPSSDSLGSFAWFVSHWSEAQSNAFPDRVHVQFEIVLYPSMTRAQVEALAREIAGRPDSPRHQIVRREKRLLELGKERVGYRVWHWNITNWRVSQDHQLELTPYADFGRRGNQVWSLTPPQMMRGHVDTMPAMREPDVSLLRRKEELFQVVYFGMGVGMASDLMPISAGLEGNEWAGEAANIDRTKVFRWRGQISSDGETIWISEWEVVRNDRYPAGVGFKARFGEPIKHEGFATPVPERVQEMRPGGDLYREIILTGASRVSRKAFEPSCPYSRGWQRRRGSRQNEPSIAGRLQEGAGRLCDRPRRRDPNQDSAA